MQEIINKLVQQASIDEATAEKVIVVIKGFLDDKLPDPIAKQVGNVLEGVDADDIGDALDSIKGLFGK